MTFGRCDGGGRRDEPRSHVAEQVVVSTRSDSSAATLVDLSLTGARLRGGRNMLKGSDILVKVGQHHLFGTIQWVRGRSCGMKFDDPITVEVYDELSKKQWSGYLWHGVLDRKLAMEDWNTSLIR